MALVGSAVVALSVMLVCLAQEHNPAQLLDMGPAEVADDESCLLQSTAEFSNGLNTTSDAMDFLDDGALNEEEISAPAYPGAWVGANAKTEDDIAFRIWEYLIAANGASSDQCKGVRGMVYAYSSCNKKWNFKGDLLNPELPGSGKPFGSTTWSRGNQEATNDRNTLLAESRVKIKSLSSGARCDRLLDMLGCPLANIRHAAPYEFVFKKAKPWVEGADNIEDNAATNAYKAVKCPVPPKSGAYTCDKNTPQEHLSPMFRFNKGRSFTKNPLIGKTLAGGLAVVSITGGKQIGSKDKFWSKDMYGLHEGAASDTPECVDLMNQFKCSDAKPVDAETCKDVKAMCLNMREERETEEEVMKGMHKEADPVCGAGCKMKEDSAAVQKLKKEWEAGAWRIVEHFGNCGVPWVGGISGSALEMFAYFEFRNSGAIDDRLVLQWCAYYIMRGFHSCGEVWSALKPWLQQLGYSPYTPQERKDIQAGRPTSPWKLLLLDVVAPLTMNGCAKKENKEATFLKGVSQVLDDLGAKPNGALSAKATAQNAAVAGRNAAVAGRNAFAPKRGRRLV